MSRSKEERLASRSPSDSDIDRIGIYTFSAQSWVPSPAACAGKVRFRPALPQIQSTRLTSWNQTSVQQIECASHGLSQFFPFATFVQGI
jgi:hypothetical protein